VTGVLEWLTVVAGSVAGGLVVFYAVAGYYHVRYYVRRRHEPQTWKLQPERMPTAKQQRKAALASTRNLVIGGVITGTLVYGLMNGMWSPIYFDVDDYGWTWTILGTGVLFVLVDGAAYYVHRFMHTKPMYRRFHRFHHKWGAPSPWVVVAVHPVEFLLLQAATFAPMFLLPFHYLSAIAVFLYVLIFNIVDHSGVRLVSILPWQGPSAYHDDHHVHFHVNFGQHLMIFDRVHGTLRRERRRYGAEVFGGKGEPEDDEGSDEVVRY